MIKYEKLKRLNQISIAGSIIPTRKQHFECGVYQDGTSITEDDKMYYIRWKGNEEYIIHKAYINIEGCLVLQDFADYYVYMICNGIPPITYRED